MEFVFGRAAEGRFSKNLIAVDDATHGAVSLVPERAMGGNQYVSILGQIAATRGPAKAIRAETGKIFVVCHAELGLAKSVQLLLIELGKPNENDYIESFNGRFREKCRKRPANPP